MSNSFQFHILQRSRLLCPWGSPSKDAGMDCHVLLQGDLPDLGIKPKFPVAPALQVDSLPLGHGKSPIYIYIYVQWQISIDLLYSNCSAPSFLLSFTLYSHSFHSLSHFLTIQIVLPSRKFHHISHQICLRVNLELRSLQNYGFLLIV